MDIITKFLADQFNGPVTVTMIVTSLVVAAVVAAFIVLVYNKTYSGVVYNKTIALCIILLALVTAMIIRTINSNLSLSLGMVGALSIVRFRTAIKEPVDTAFMFWAITAGIMSGAGLYIIAIVGSLVVGVCFYIAYMIGTKAKSQYLLVVIYNAAVEESVQGILNTITKKHLKSKSLSAGNQVEITYEIDYSKDTDSLMKDLQSIEGVRTVNLVSYRNDFGL